MRGVKALFTLLLVAFLAGDLVVTAGLLSKKLETDVEKKYNQYSGTLAEAELVHVGSLFRSESFVFHFLSNVVRFAETDCFKFLLLTDYFSMG